MFDCSGTPTLNGSLLGRIDFNGLDSGGGSHNYARMAVKMADKGAGTEDGILFFDLTDGGTDFIEHLNMGNGTVTVNDDKKNVIFRVEGDTNDSLIRTSATLNNVAIGGIPTSGLADNNPILQVNGSINGKMPIIIQNSDVTLTRDGLSAVSYTHLTLPTKRIV